MRLHDLLKQVSAVLTPRTDSFCAFILESADNNWTFLRTRSCLDQLILFMHADSINADVSATRKGRLKDAEVGEFSRVLVCFRKPFTEGDQYYEQRITSFGQGVTDVMVSCELYLDCYDDEDIRVGALSAYDDGYKYAYVIDLINKTYSVDTLPVIEHQNLIMIDLGSADDLFYGGRYFDDQGVEHDLKATKNMGTFVDTVLITIDNPEIDVFESFVCRYRITGSDRVELYRSRHDLLVRDNCSLLIENESAAELTVSIPGTDYTIPENGQKYISTIDWGHPWAMKSSKGVRLCD